MTYLRMVFHVLFEEKKSDFDTGASYGFDIEERIGGLCR